MAHLNRIMVIGRVVFDIDPAKDVRTFESGAKVTKLRFVITNRRFNKQTKDWEDDPVWIDLKCWNKGENGKLADKAATLRKGQLLLIEGELVQESWTDKVTQKQVQRIVINVSSLGVLDYSSGRGERGGGQERPAQTAQTTQRPTSAVPSGHDAGYDADDQRGSDADDIPF